LSFDLIKVKLLERFKVQPDGRERSFQFMSNRVDKSIVLLVAAYLANEEGSVENETSDYQQEKDYAENQQGDFARVEQNPANIQRHSQRDQTSAERYEECYRLTTTTYRHVGIVAVGGGQWSVASGR
jgi:hypothetical protein